MRFSRSFCIIFFYCSLAALIASLLWWGWQTAVSAKFLAFHQVNIVVNGKKLHSAEVKKIVAKNLSGGFFSLRTNRLRQSLLAQPWVADVSLRRRWPDQLDIHISQQHPVAVWCNKQLINQSGELFSPPIKSFPQTLVHLCGPRGRLQGVMDQLKQSREVLLKAGLVITSLNLNARNTWSMTVNRQIDVILGRQDIHRRLMRFVSLYLAVIQKNVDNVAKVDLRYPNGVAIQWRK